MTGQSLSDIQNQAARWVARKDGSRWTQTCEAELEQWLALDPRHAGAMLRAEAAWMALDPAIAETEPVFPATRRRILVGAGSAVAASVVAGWFVLSESRSYRTAIGEIRRVPLEDGSIATINTDSRIEVDLGSAQRDVRVEGEAWFQVAKDARRPFVVEAGRVRVRAVGTAFSVRRRVNGADILVTEGVVEAWSNGAEGHRIRLQAGDGAFVADDAGIVVKPLGPSSVDRALAWRGGKIDLVGATLAEAASEFNRYNRRSIVISDAALGAETFDGTFRIDDPQGFASAVASSLGADVTLPDGKTIRISRRRKNKMP